MALDFFTRWETNLFSTSEYGLMLPVWNRIIEKLEEKQAEIYFDFLKKYLMGYTNVNQFTKEISELLPLEALEDHDEFFATLMSMCALNDIIDDSRKNKQTIRKGLNKADDHLPSAFNINALLILNCLKHGFQFPSGDPGKLINNIVRCVLKERIESAIRVKKTSAINDHGFIKYFGQDNTMSNEVTTITSREFFDSLVLTDSINLSRLERQLENCESHTNFFFKMLQQAYNVSEDETD